MEFDPGSIPFRAFAQILTQMRQMRGGRAKNTIFYKFITEKGGKVGELGVIEDILRSADNEDLNNFRTGTTMLARKVEKALQIQRNQIRLDAPNKVYATLRQLVHPIVDRHTVSEQSSTISHVYAQLKEIMKKSGEDESESLRQLFDSCDQNELLWVFAIMTKSVVTALDWNSAALRDMLKPSGNDDYKNNRDMKRTDVEAESGYPLMCNFEPMLLARLDMNDWYAKIKKYAGENYFMELKFDGEHVVIHKRGSEWRVVTRNGKDFTKYYDGTDGRKNVIAELKTFLRPNVENCVIDCELMLFDEIDKKYVRHHQKCANGTTYNFQNIKEGEPVHLAVVILDILLINEHNLMGTSCEKRIKALETLLLRKQDKEQVFIPERQTGNSREDVERFFNIAMANNEEGVVVKRRDTVYNPGRRWNRNGWFKVKANLTEGAHIDVVVVGVRYEGTQREQQFVIAVRKTFGSTDDENEDDEFELKVVGGIGAGLTKKERQWIIEEGTRYGPLQPFPPSAIGGSEIKQGGYFGDWDDMKVVEVRCAGKQGFSLQHASIVRIRLDKDIHRVDTLRDYMQMEEKIKQGGLPALDEVVIKAREKEERKRKGKVEAPTKQKIMRDAVIPSSERGTISWQLRDAIVCVIPGKSDKRAKELGEIVRGFGAALRAIPDDNTSFLIAETANVNSTRKRIREEKWTIVDGKWLERCQKEGKVVEWDPSEIVYEKEGGYKLQIEK